MRKAFAVHPTLRGRTEPSTEAGSPDMPARREVFRATVILGALYAAGFCVLVARGFTHQALDTVRYAVLLGSLTALSGWIYARSKSVANPVPTVRFVCDRRIILAGAAIFIAMCAVLATQLDVYANTHAGTTFIDALIAAGGIRFAIEAAAGILIVKGLGATDQYLGLGRPSRIIVPIAILWIGCALVFLATDIAHGGNSIAGEVARTINHFFRAGVPEEFLFRGMLLALLAGAIRPAYANLVQALACGVWHYGIDGSFAHHDPAVMVALMICVHAVFGYGLGLVRLWTRSLAVPMVFHSIADSTAII